MRSQSGLIKAILFLVIVFLINYASYGQAINSYFWKDDWAWLWSSNFAPADFFGSTVGTNWITRTGIFMYPYVLYAHRLFRDSNTWQIIGFWLKVINSILFYFFVYSFTRKGKLAVLGSLLYASYSGGIESYTWHKLNAVATSFILMGFTFYSNFINSQKLRFFLLALPCFILALFAYTGRSAGIALVAIFWGVLTLWEKEIHLRGKAIIAAVIFFIFIAYLILIRWVNTQQVMPNGYLLTALENHKLFFGIIGNLLKNPFIKIDEIGYLAQLNRNSFILGYGLFITGFVLGIVFFIKRQKALILPLLFIGWIFLFYLPNWIFGGGGINTILASGHRYLAVSGVGVVSLWLMLIKKFKKVKLAVIILLVLNLNYSAYVVGLESQVRHKDLVEPIYNKLFERMSRDADVQLIVIDVPNKLASFVVGGWYPYTYAYYRGLPDVTNFPVVISRWGTAVQWACAPTHEERLRIRGLMGFGDNQNILHLNPEHSYAWTLAEDGSLTDKTDDFRKIMWDCSVPQQL